MAKAKTKANKKPRKPKQPKTKGQKAAIVVIIMLIVIALVVAGYFIIKSQKEKKQKAAAAAAAFETKYTDMTDPANDEFGAMYYAPLEEEHIAENQYTKYVDNEALIIVKDGTEREKVEELAKKYSATIVGEIALTGDYQLRFNKVPSKNELDKTIDKLGKESIVQMAILNYVDEYAPDSNSSSNSNRSVFTPSQSNRIPRNNRPGQPFSVYVLLKNTLYQYGNKWSSDLENATDTQGKSWGWETINTYGAWELLKHPTRAINPVKVGLVDGGFYNNHNDLNFCQIFYDNHGNNYSLEDIVKSPEKYGITDAEKQQDYKDAFEHGTHVAGTMAASSLGDNGICGVYPYGNTTLYGASFMGSNSCNCSIIAYKVCIAELVLHNVKVINISMGEGFHYEPSFSDWYQNENDEHFAKLKIKAEYMAIFLDQLIKAKYDFVITTSAGNDSYGINPRFEAKNNSCFTKIKDLIDSNKELKYPDVCNRIIVVGSVNRSLHLSSFSNDGTAVDIFAPGGDKYSYNTEEQNNKEMIYSLTAFDDNGNITPNYGYMCGTSMAAPHVAGVAAMVWSANNTISGQRVKEIITGHYLPCYRSASERSAASVAGVSTFKLLDAEAAVQAALEEPLGEELPSADYGLLSCYVVDKEHRSAEIIDATVTLTNINNTKDVFTQNTDQNGHVEIAVPSGSYSLSATAPDYKDYSWPDGDTTLPEHITILSGEVCYPQSWILMAREDNAPELETNADGSYKNSINSDDFHIHEGSDDFGGVTYDLDIPLEDVIAWTEYNGHLYALYDYAISARAMSLVTSASPSVHLVTISDKNEQQAVEELMELGGRNVYYTGGEVDSSGKLSWITGESASYKNWYDGCPCDYDEAGYDDIVVLWRGEEYEATDDPDFGTWMEVLENDMSYLDIFDYELEGGVTCGVIVEWDDPDLPK